TVTTGVAAVWSLSGRRPDADAEKLFRRADERLLHAKRDRPGEAGRSRGGPSLLAPLPEDEAATAAVHREAAEHREAATRAAQDQAAQQLANEDRAAEDRAAEDRAAEDRAAEDRADDAGAADVRAARDAEVRDAEVRAAA